LRYSWPAFACVAVLSACGGHLGKAVVPPDSPSAVAAVPARIPGGDWPRFNYDAQRSGVGPASTGISTHDAGTLKTRVIHIDGVADSSAVQASAVRVRGRRRDIAVVTTTYGKSIAFDPGTGAKLWEYTPPTIGSYQGGHQVTTATPILDPDRRYVYTVSPDGQIHKLALATGREVRSGNWPVRIATDPTHEKIAPALNMSGSAIVAVTGGYYGDAPPYQGHVVLIDRATGRIAHVWNSLCSDRHYLISPPSSCPASDSAIWARAGAVIEPGSGRILIATGNGPFNGSTNWGDSVLELTPDAGRLLRNWTPPDQAQLEASDTDLGSTAPALLGTVGGHKLVLQGGKDDKLHLLDLNRLNGTTGGPGPRLGGELNEIDAPGGAVFTAPAIWNHGRRTYVFVTGDSGMGAYVIAGGARPHLVQIWNKGTGGTSPVVAGGLLYVYDEANGFLKIFDPPSGRTIASLPVPTGHWNSPIVVSGRIILPVGGSTSDNAPSGQVYIFHLPRR
jgi:PQQ-like domain